TNRRSAARSSPPSTSAVTGRACSRRSATWACWCSPAAPPGTPWGRSPLAASAPWHSVGRRPLLPVLALIYIHAMFFAFLVNAFHEFVHQTVFKTKAINTFFLQLVSFVSWQNPVMFWASHQEHHRYTLHPPEDMEVVLPQTVDLKCFLKLLVINPWDFYFRLRLITRLAFGRLDTVWEKTVFSPSAR